ncbi:hypothetical protein GBR81_20520 [Escherichia coli]|nr:hypothetical protein [Escherichia coli]
MSIDALRWAKKVKTGSSSSKSVLTWLADMCGADLCAYPSVSALAEVTELNKKTVQDSLRHPINADERHVMIPKENGSWLYLIDLEHALRVAGIRIKGEEHGNKTRG